MSRIVVVAPALDEAPNIDRFCRSYIWADKIIIADGGCTDETVALALCYPNVEVLPFNLRVRVRGYHAWRNPLPQMFEALGRHALESQPDFIIADHVDCVPNFMLRDLGRRVIESKAADVLAVVRINIWGKDNWFPRLSTPVDPGVWDARPWCYKVGGDPSRVQFIPPAMCLLHFPWPDIYSVLRKQDLYHADGLGHPLKECGPLAPLPAWAHL